MTTRQWIQLVLSLWIIGAAGMFTVRYWYDLHVRRFRHKHKPAPLAVYAVALNACICLILLSALISQFTPIDTAWFRGTILFGVALVTTYGLRLFLRYRRNGH